MITKAHAIKLLIQHRGKIKPDDANLPLLEAVDCALSEIGKCVPCHGTGTVISDKNIGPGYNRKIGPRGAFQFLYPCNSCAGGGKILTVSCCSCGESKELLSGQKHYTHCADCENRLTRSGAL